MKNKITIKKISFDSNKPVHIEVTGSSVQEIYLAYLQAENWDLRRLSARKLR